MTAPDPAWVEAVAHVINDEGGQPGSSLHSWRCEYPDRYGPCDCVEQTAEAIIAAVEPLIRERIAQQIEEFADDWSDWSALVQAHEDLVALRDVVKDAVHDAAAIARGDEQ